MQLVGQFMHKHRIRCLYLRLHTQQLLIPAPVIGGLESAPWNAEPAVKAWRGQMDNVLYSCNICAPHPIFFTIRVAGCGCSNVWGLIKTLSVVILQLPGLPTYQHRAESSPVGNPLHCSDRQFSSVTSIRHSLPRIIPGTYSELHVQFETIGSSEDKYYW